MSGLSAHEARALQDLVAAVIGYRNRNSRMLCTSFLTTPTDSRYAELVKHPRSLLDIQSKVANGAYPVASAVYADLKLCFRNAQLAYGKSKDAHIDAARMETAVDEIWESMPALPPVSSFGSADPYTRPIGPHSSVAELGAATDAIHNKRSTSVPGTPADAESSQFAALLVGGTPTIGSDAGVSTPPASGAPKKRGRPPKPRADFSEASTAAGTPASDFGAQRAGTPIDVKPFAHASSTAASATASAAFALAAATAPIPQMPASMPAPAAIRLQALPALAPATPPKPSLEPAQPTPIELAADTDQFHAMSAEATTAFRTDPRTGELIWFPAPPAVVPRRATPTHSLAYLEHCARRRDAGEDAPAPIAKRARPDELLQAAAALLDQA